MPRGRLIGLDIGAGSIRAVETRRGKGGLSLVNFGQVALPPGAVQSGVIKDDQVVIAALKQLWSDARLRCRRVVLGVTNPQVVVRETTVTSLPREQLLKSLPFQVRDALPLPVDRALLDFYPLADPGPDRDDGAGQTVTGLLIAAPKDAVLPAVRTVEKAGLHVERVDLAAFALLRALSWLDDQVEAIVDIGAHTTSVVIHSGGQPLIVRTVPRGGVEITEAVAGRLRIAPADAEEIKCRIGLRAGHDPHAAAAVKDAVRPLLNEVNSSFTYLSTAAGPGRAARVARLALSGGGAMLPGLVDELRDLLGVNVVVADVAARLRNGRSRHDTVGRLHLSAAVSIGLTLGAA